MTDTRMLKECTILAQAEAVRLLKREGPRLTATRSSEDSPISLFSSFGWFLAPLAVKWIRTSVPIIDDPRSIWKVSLAISTIPCCSPTHSSTWTSKKLPRLLHPQRPVPKHSRPRQNRLPLTDFYPLAPRRTKGKQPRSQSQCLSTTCNRDVRSFARLRPPAFDCVINFMSRLKGSGRAFLIRGKSTRPLVSID